MDSVSIDLVICTYNNAAYLDRVLTAIGAQQVSQPVQWRVLVVNNNCTDDTLSVVERHRQAEAIPHLQMVVEPKQGLTPARLCGVNHTTGDWIAFVDDDCVLDATWVEEAAAFARLHPDCGGFGGKVILHWQTPPPDYVLQFGYSFAEQNHGELPKPVSCLVGAGMIVRRSALQESGWIDRQFMSDRVGKKLVSGGDVELALRLAAKYQLWYTPDCTLLHLIPDRRTSLKYLIKINYGLGSSQLFGDSMLYPRSYGRWFWVSIKRTLRPSIAALITGLKVLARKRSLEEWLIQSSFVLGRWAGIGRMAGMDRAVRGALLGCAVTSPKSSNQTLRQLETQPQPSESHPLV